MSTHLVAYSSMCHLPCSIPKVKNVYGSTRDSHRCESLMLYKLKPKSMKKLLSNTLFCMKKIMMLF